LRDVVEPVAEDLLGLRSDGFGERFCRRAQLRDRDISGGQFDGMADIPFLELSRVGLEMELQRERIAAVGEGPVVVIGVRGFGAR
jgi:hypothetical protein